MDHDHDHLHNKPRRARRYYGRSDTGGAYFLAIVGAACHFVQQAHGFWPVVLALLKALVWPAFLIYYAFQALKVA
jgi:hypothetical protein